MQNQWLSSLPIEVGYRSASGRAANLVLADPA
jgi:hypothetical protein